MTQIHLNLSRKWRSKQFDTVIGQELSLRILQNSLYANQFFPVYLFSGQRGCGKTTTARIFAAALNCQELTQFQKNPKLHKIPCLACDSCKAMAAGSYPDFIEIDAASHTGVDNVRNIIEAASLLPVLGNKKVYLIDEAHMLSKAAFNAFLKILEEPPASVLFLLATTDPHKIIETVRSRCFQLFFTAVPTEIVVKHLVFVCQQEGIEAQQEALYVIASETEGSVRDALNLLEQVRFSHSIVTLEAVLKMLGHMPESLLLDIFESIVNGDLKQLLVLLQSCSFEQYVPLSIWKKSIDVVRSFLFLKQSVSYVPFFKDDVRIHQLAQLISLARTVSFLHFLYRYEFLVLKSTSAHKVLEMLFLELCQTAEKKSEKISEQESQAVVLTTGKHLPAQGSDIVASASIVKEVDQRWQGFVSEIEKLSDPLLQSIFKQAQYESFEQERKKVSVFFLQEAAFFKDWLIDTKGVWQPLLEKFFDAGSELEALFDKVKKETYKEPQKIEKKMLGSEIKKYNAPLKHEIAQKKEKIIDISDTQKWQKAHALQEAFGGLVVAVQDEDIHDQAGQ